MSDFNTALGLRPGDDGSVVLEARGEHLAGPETVHFAVLATLAEVSAARAVAAPVVPASLTLHLLRRARPVRLIGRGTLLHRGRRIAVAEGSVYDGTELVAKATVSFALI